MKRLAAAALLLAASLGAAPLAGPGKETVIKAVSRPARPRQGQVFTVEIRARHLRDTGSVAFHLVFDPSQVEPVPSGFSEGPVLGRGGSRTSFLAAPASTGDRIIVGLARLGSTRGAGGKGPLCRLAFRAIGDGPVAFVFDQARVADPAATPIPARFLPGHAEVIPARPGRKE